MKENASSFFDSNNKTKARILLVEDDRSILGTFRRILKKTGYLVDTAGTGRDALRIIQTKEYDIFLVDVCLPDIDGIELLPKFKTAWPEAIMIICTGFPSLETGVRALNYGVDAYMVKPVRPSELTALLEEKLNIKKEEMKKQQKKYFY